MCSLAWPPWPKVYHPCAFRRFPTWMFGRSRSFRSLSSHAALRCWPICALLMARWFYPTASGLPRGNWKIPIEMEGFCMVLLGKSSINGGVSSATYLSTGGYWLRVGPCGPFRGLPSDQLRISPPSPGGCWWFCRASLQTAWISGKAGPLSRDFGRRSPSPAVQLF